jgi:hypothetical protein
MDCLEMGGTARKRRVLQFHDLVPNCNFTVHNNSYSNLRRGILERIFFVKDKESPDGFAPPVKPTPGAWSDDLRKFRSRCKRHLQTTIPDTPQEFVERYWGRKKAIYTRAAEAFIESGVQRKHSYVSTFVKAEKTNLTAKPDPAPRVIQPRNPQYNVAIGIYLKKIEHDVYEAINRVFGGPTVAKGRNAYGVGEMFATNWAAFKRPAALSIDAVRFDQHCSVDALRYEHSFYRYIYNNDPELNRLLLWQLENMGFGRSDDGEVRYRTRGCRMSGDMNTAIGNVILMCAMVWTACRAIGVRKFRLVNNGDDCVIIVERRFASRLAEALPTLFRRWGYQITMEKAVTRLEDIEFCQTHPVFDGERWTVVRNFPVCLAKDAISIKSITNAESCDAYRTAIGQCGLSCYGNIPVLGAFYDYMCRDSQRMAQEEVETGFQFLSRGMGHRRAAPSDEARVSFYLAFGFDPDHQIALEEMYDNAAFSWREPPLVQRFHGRPELRRPLDE